MNKAFQFEVPVNAVPLVEISDVGVYVRFQIGARVKKTLVRSEWPHIAVDLAADGSVIGIESVPAPGKFTVGRLAEQAGVFVPAGVLQNEPQIQATPPSSAFA
jgi:hypothetical protein